jgi:hypothetical protein
MNHYECPACDWSGQGDSVDALADHFQQAHPGSYGAQCTRCGRVHQVKKGVTCRRAA